MTLLKSAFGSVRPYTRHVTGCRSKDDSCSCPKWLYEHQKGCERRRYALETPSWAEAQRIAANKLRGFDPEIAAARTANERRTAALMTVRDAGDLWIKRTETQFGEDAGALPQYRTLMKMWIEWADRHHIAYVQDITPLQLEAWYGSKEWLRFSDATRKQRWGVLRSVFKFLEDRGVLEENPIAGIRSAQIETEHAQGPYTDEQVTAIFAHIDETVPQARMAVAERDVYALRLRAFITLLLHVGCDVIDGVQFNHDHLEDAPIDGRMVPVYRYRREKTGVQAVVPVTADVAATLRSVPFLHRNPENMPFRHSDNDVLSDVHNWSRRIARVLDTAGVKWVELPRDRRGKPRRKPSNAKQFRHTFAVRQLVKGMRPEVLARQLGHVDTTMIHRHYAPWVPALDESYIREVVSLL